MANTRRGKWSRRVKAKAAELRAIETKWACPPSAAQYILALERYIQRLERLCTELGHTECSKSLQARIIEGKRTAMPACLSPDT